MTPLLCVWLWGAVCTVMQLLWMDVNPRQPLLTFILTRALMRKKREDQEFADRELAKRETKRMND